MEIKDIIGVAVVLVYGIIALIVTGRIKKSLKESLKSLPDFNRTVNTIAILIGVFWFTLLPKTFIHCYRKMLDSKKDF